MPESNKIQTMFSEIAHGYDRANEILSLGLYKRWYRNLIEIASPINNDKIVDLATGTGNLAILFKKHNKNLSVSGIDFSKNMLDIAEKKSRASSLEINWQIGDATNLEYPDNTFDIATISFGIRNVNSIDACLEEMARIVKSNGKILILEFGTPKGVTKSFYKFYSNNLIPILGGFITGKRNAYTYLNKSSLEFPYGEKFINIINQSQLFKNMYYKPLSQGIAFLYYAEVL